MKIEFLGMKTKFKDPKPIRYIETRDHIFIVKTLSKSILADFRMCRRFGTFLATLSKMQ